MVNLFPTLFCFLNETMFLIRGAGLLLTPWLVEYGTGKILIIYVHMLFEYFKIWFKTCEKNTCRACEYTYMIKKKYVKICMYFYNIFDFYENCIIRNVWRWNITCILCANFLTTVKLLEVAYIFILCYKLGKHSLKKDAYFQLLWLVKTRSTKHQWRKDA